ncbi:1-(5-phosphoribosyl)-5-[(5-phosphoribosylamino)methylideneamino]imidazole-4-carboxamide isomerase [Clostridium sp. 1001271B_151109_B4]|uniref:1-(5-phosphoribosyl)-5-[(5- phosphoribosylamino)methylideneamino]imidazole-4- carboxamide isomerase n=1 Tax=Clostridium sp. 1001271B_151109_B4 TaxID=2787148 RepID=UPI0018A96F0F|nr:1-(5-phosphoribosyl)-5-[(5-phosphoribosylamino)methylideneamino]imidazole-4-carboxamide isomerase [Clostridium sp. 1001271B_151109_B4]
MIIIPAIDIIDGKPVRLYQGDYDKKEIVGEDILEISKGFENAGASYIHLVDLDGAKKGELVNKEIIIKVVNEVNVPVEVGGGIRTYQDVKYLIDNGVSRVILGTVAIEDSEFVKRVVNEFGEKIAVGVDCKNEYLCGRGWIEESKLHYISFSKKMEELGVKNIILTDISKDGTLKGTNIDMLKKLGKNIEINLTASGGVAGIDDIKELKNLNIYGVIVGKAIYSGYINLKEAIDLCKTNS